MPRQAALIFDLLETVGALFVLCPVFVIFFPVILITGLCRLLLAVYLRARYGDSVMLMSAMDAAWAYETPTSTSTCHGLYFIKGNCVPEKVRENTQRILDGELYEGSFSRCIIRVCGFPCWKKLEDAEMNLEKYIEVVPRPKGQDPAKMDEISSFLASHDNPSPPNQAPWKIYIFPDVECPDSRSTESEVNPNDKYYAVVYKLSHSIMDGISSGNLIYNMVADKKFKFIIDPCTLPRPSWLRAGILHLLGIISTPRALVRGLLYSDRTLLTQSEVLELTGPKSMSWSRPIDFEAVKDIKKRTETNVMSILLSCLGGAFYGTFNFPPSRNIIHALVTSILLPYPQDRRPSNRVSGVNAPVLMSDGRKAEDSGLLVSSEVERLLKNHENLIVGARYSSSALVMANSFFVKMTGFLPWAHRAISMGNHLRFSISNVPGPAEDVYMYEGDRVVEMAIWLPIKFTIGLGVGAFTYKNRLRLSFIGDGAYFPGESFSGLIKRFEEELTNLGHSVGVKDLFLD